MVNGGIQQRLQKCERMIQLPHQGIEAPEQVIALLRVRHGKSLVRDYADLILRSSVSQFTEMMPLAV